jgi:hypothetical protein
MSTPVSSQLATRRARLLAIAGGVVLVATPVTLSELLRKPCPVCVECEVCPECEECPEPEPEEGTLLFEERFDDANIRERGWYDGRVIVEDGAAVFRWRVGASLPDSGGAMRIEFPPTEAVRLRFRMRLSENWVGSPGPATWPHLIYLTTNLDARYVPPAWTRTTAYLQPSGRRVMAILQDGVNVNRDFIRQDAPTENRAVNGCNSLPAPGVDCYLSGTQWRNGRYWPSSVDTFTPGRWHLVEAEYRMNTVANGVGLADGSVKVWVDGALVVDVEGIVIRTGQNPTMEWQFLLLGPWLGSSPVDQSIHLDDLSVSAVVRVR